MTSEEILASITWHYTISDRLNGAQLAEHKMRGSCSACERPPTAADLAAHVFGRRDIDGNA